MITSDTLIQMDENGSNCRMGDLSIGQYILNPLSGKKTEIIDILTRNVVISSEEDLWIPVEIPVGLIGQHRPFAPLFISARQMIMKKSSSSGTQPPEIEFVAAKDITGARSVNVKEVTYSAIFLEKPMPFLANGVLCLSFSNDVYR